MIVYKITLPHDVDMMIGETQIVQIEDVEVGAEFLHAREYGKAICVWYRCEPGAPRVPHRFTVVGTGQPAPNARYIGTTIRNDRVGHVFVEPI